MNLKKLNEKIKKLMNEQEGDLICYFENNGVTDEYYLVKKNGKYKIDGNIEDPDATYNSRVKALRALANEFSNYDTDDLWDSITIEDEDFEEILEDVINEDDNESNYKVNEKTFADWFGQDLTGQTYEGDINCAGQRITSLKGAPQKVIGYFGCMMNYLSTLEGAPQEVSGTFNCAMNPLISLKGGPQKVGETFKCEQTKLTNLKGAPEYVGKHFLCDLNKLTTLAGAPQKVGGDFLCDKARKNEARKLGYRVV